MNTIINNFKFRIILAFAGIYIIWGTTYLAITYGLKGFPPFILSGFRFLIAGILILTWLFSKGEKPNSLINWYKNFIPGLFILAAGVGLVAWGEQYVTSTEAAIIMATEPFWFIIMDRKNWKRYFSSPLVITGLLIGIGGLLLFVKDSLLNGSHSEHADLRVIAIGVLFVSSVIWVIGSLFSKNRASSHSIFMNVGQQLIVGGIVSLLVATTIGEWGTFNVSAVPTEAWSGLLYLIFFGSIAAYLSFIWLLSVRPPALVSTHTYVNPVVAVLAGWLIAGESISVTQSWGLIIILIGVLLTNSTTYTITKRTKVRWRPFIRIIKRLGDPYRHFTHS
ncbi:EamA family transporter [Flavobacterium sp. DG1-102-2]|uniref:EamA family transporter n=1 Tax=Flavobacterium sp. DG1-102-2 TaxID=3081663 RepID=UPI002948E21E|nr:EamA family transporter [Flavobacterium sp. DG1-102-2]MDV6169787.1 EamA family transporter [Flavobacterium sp. DG1-102-2]